MFNPNLFVRLSLFLIVLHFQNAFVRISSQSLPPIKIDGNVLRYSHNNTRWYAMGMGYDYAVDDSSESNWRPALTQALQDVPNLNALRIYVLDETKSYTQFIHFTQQHGIYNLIAVTPSTGSCLLNRAGVPDLKATVTCYPSCLLSFGQNIINIFSNATNTLAFMIGNEVMDSYSHWQAAPCVKAYTRDLKAYQRSCANQRYIPLIYTDADNAIPDVDLSADNNHVLRVKYLTCGPESDRIDMYGINVFRWCADDETFQNSWYPFFNALANAYGDGVAVNIPMLLTEYGCGQFYSSVSPGSPRVQRTWNQVAVLYSPDMSPLFSGGFAYTYGLRGGPEFAFYINGSIIEDGSPPMTKNCGNNNTSVIGAGCNVDYYSSHLQTALTSGLPQAVVPSTLTNSSQTCNITFFGNFSLAEPPTRQDADGYTSVSCPQGQVATPNTPDSSSSGSGQPTLDSQSSSTGTSSQSQSQSSSGGNDGNTRSAAAQITAILSAILSIIVAFLIALTK